MTDWLGRELYYISKYQKNQQNQLSLENSTSLTEGDKKKKSKKRLIIVDDDDDDDTNSQNTLLSSDILDDYYQTKLDENSKEQSGKDYSYTGVDEVDGRFELADIYTKKTLLELFPPEDEQQEQAIKQELSAQQQRIKQLFATLGKENKDNTKKSKKKKNRKKKKKSRDEAGDELDGDEEEEEDTVTTSKSRLETFDLLLFKQQGSIQSERPLFFEQFATLMNNRLFHDVVFRIVETDEQIYAHKTILQLRSEYFRTLFTSGMSESEALIPIIDIDLPTDIFLILLEFIYTGKLKVTPKNAINVLAGANQFGLGDAKELLSNYFKSCLDPATVCYILEEANFYHAKDLFLFCMLYIVNNAAKVFTKENLKYLSTETFRKVLHTQALSMDEYSLFLACVEWAKVRAQVEKEEQSKSLQQIDMEDIDEEGEEAAPIPEKPWQDYFAEIVDLIHFGAMEAKTIRDNIEQHKQLRQIVPMRIILEAYKSMVLPSEVVTSKNGPRNGNIVFKFDDTSLPNDTTLSNNKLKATCNAAVTNTILGNITLYTGRVYYFEIKIHNCSSPNDIMIGVCDKTTYDKYSFLSHNARGWAYYGYNGSVYHNSIETNYASAFKAGDVVGVLVDLRKGTIAFILNGKNLGVAFSGLKGPLYPAVSLYNNGDCVSILNHTSYIKGGTGSDTEDLLVSEKDEEEETKKEEEEEDDAQSGGNTPVLNFGSVSAANNVALY